jgi:hypothetical protein
MKTLWLSRPRLSAPCRRQALPPELHTRGRVCHMAQAVLIHVLRRTRPAERGG